MRKHDSSCGKKRADAAQYSNYLLQHISKIFQPDKHQPSVRQMNNGASPRLHDCVEEDATVPLRLLTLSRSASQYIHPSDHFNL